MDDTNTVGWWIFGVVVVLLVLLAVWWATTNSTPTPGVPNTGSDATTSMNASPSTSGTGY